MTWQPGDLALLRAIALDRTMHPGASVPAKPAPAGRDPDGRDPDSRSTRQASLARSYGGITGRASVCGDRAAFAGPLGGS